MKRFVFTLQVLLKVKLSLEKVQKAELNKVQTLLHQQLQQLAAMHTEQREKNDAFQQETSEGITPDRMVVYGHYFEHLREMILEQGKRIEETRKEKAKCQAILIRTMKEIKTLKKLREAQYQEYQAEVAKEEAEAINEIVTYKTAAGGS